MQTLHLTNGDHAAAVLSRSGLSGAILPWRDVLHDGPVPPDHDRAVFAAVRAAFLAEAGWTTVEAVTTDLQSRDAALDAVPTEGEVCLWFEPDLYDQLQMLQVLSRLATREPSARPRITIVPVDDYLGPVEPAHMPPLFAARRDITAEDLHTAAAAWHAFTSPMPVQLSLAVSDLDAHARAHAYADDHAVRLPHLAAAVRRMLEEYPDTSGGLSRTERQICTTLAPARSTLGALFQAQQSAETWYWLGDLGFAWYVQRLSACDSPLIVHDDGRTVLAPARGAMSAWLADTVQLTAFGHDVVQGKADHIAANGIDRWFGGAHATVATHWRWDGQQQRLLSSAA